MSGLSVAPHEENFPACMATTKALAVLLSLRMNPGSRKKSLFTQKKLKEGKSTVVNRDVNVSQFHRAHLDHFFLN